MAVDREIYAWTSRNRLMIADVLQALDVLVRARHRSPDGS
jgi:hypothetical protein